MSEAPAFSVVLHYDPMMVAELAMGADHPHEIAERYGVDAVDYEHLASQEWFARLVAQKRTEFHDTGVLFTAKAGMMAEALLTRLFQQSMANVLTPPLVVEVAKQLTDIGRLKPQPLNTTPGSAGGAFQINIQVNGSDVIHTRPTLLEAPSVPDPTTISSMAGTSVAAPAPTLPEAKTGAVMSPRPTSPGVARDAPTISLDFTPPKGAPPASISNLRVPDFDLRPSALVGGAAAQQAALATPAPGPSTYPTSTVGLPLASRPR